MPSTTSLLLILHFSLTFTKMKQDYTFHDWVREFRVGSAYTKPTPYFSQHDWQIKKEDNIIKTILKSIFLWSY